MEPVQQHPATRLPLTRAAESQRREPAPPSPAAGDVLSFIWPGFGHGYQGCWPSAALLAFPYAVLVAYALSELIRDPQLFAVRLFSPSFALAVLGAVAFSGVWRVAALVDCHRIAVSGAWRLHWRAGALMALLLVVTVGAHALAGYYAWSFYRAGSAIFNEGPPAAEIPAPDPTAGDSGPGDTRTPRPTPTPAVETGVTERISILLLGFDRGRPDRPEARTDTILVLSLDPDTQTATMVSFSRGLRDFPLYTGGTYRNLLNTFWHHAETHSEQYPNGPAAAMKEQVGYLLGTRVHYYASIDLFGFMDLLKAVGGVDVVNEREIRDEAMGFYVPVGPVHLNYYDALRFVRSRHTPGGSDTDRARRQQQVLLALREKLTSSAGLAALPTVLEVVSKNVRTDLPPDRVTEWYELGQRFQGEVRRHIIGVPAYSVPVERDGEVQGSRLKIDRLAALSIALFGEESRYAGFCDDEPPPPFCSVEPADASQSPAAP